MKFARALKGAIPAALALLAAMAVAGPASAQTFDCSIRGTNSKILVTMAAGGSRATLSDSFGQYALGRSGSGLFQGRRNDGVDLQFDPAARTLWLGSEQFGCDVVQASNQSGGGINRQGRSLGGNMRSGPGTNYDKVAGLPEGTPVTILSDSGVRFDGYNWFEVVLDNGMRGFQWGGIMCSNGDRLNGIYSACGAPVQNVQSGGGWMAFAMGSGGRWGHGAGATLSQARQFALQYCGGADCRVEDETQARCHALALGRGTHWFGAAQSENQARDYAMGFCTASSSGCRIEYTYCQ